MPHHSFVKLWLDKIIGTATETTEDTLPDPIPSTSKAVTSQSLSRSQSIELQDSHNKSVKSSIQDTPSSSKSLPVRESFSRSSMESMLKQKIPNVLRSTSVDAKYQIIPPLPRLYLGDNPVDKLSRILTKIDSMTIEEEEDSPLSTEVAKSTNKTKYD